MKKLFQTLCLCFIVTATAFADDDDDNRGRGRGRDDDYCEPAVIPEASTYGAGLAVVSIGAIVWLKRNRKA